MHTSEGKNHYILLLSSDCIENSFISYLYSISEGLALKCAELLGCPMVYELVEYARECLTDNNLPCSRCAICQVQFQASSIVQCFVGTKFGNSDC